MVDICILGHDNAWRQAHGRKLMDKIDEEWQGTFVDIQAANTVSNKFREALPEAAEVIVQTMEGLSGNKEAYKAAVYIVERMLGKPKEQGGDNPYSDLLQHLRSNDVPAVTSSDSETE